MDFAGIIAILILIGVAWFLIAAVKGLWTVLCYKVTVNETHVGLLYKDGKFVKRLEAGAYRICRLWLEIKQVDTRQTNLTVPGQELVTQDNVGLKVSMVCTYQVSDPEKATHEVTSYQDALYTDVQLLLRELTGSRTLEALLSDRNEVGETLLKQLVPLAEAYGLSVQRVQIKDLMFPGELKKIFAEVVRAKHEGLAALERARGETAALRNLANAAKLMDNQPSLMSLRLLQSFSSGEHGNTLVLGMPEGLPAFEAKPKPAKKTSSSKPK